MSDLAQSLPVASALPFALLLLAIALLPLVAGHWWEHNRNRALVAAILSVPFALYLAIEFGAAGLHELRHAGTDYLSFMALLGSLFVISGGIRIRGSLSGTPLANVGFLAIGAVLANIIGTTGASMVLIRPFLNANAERKHKAHLVIFFIFVVSNCGGLLTPLGDPPLFLGFLKGVPFAWTLLLWKEWLLVNGCLLLIFHFFDEWQLNRDQKRTKEPLLKELLHHAPLRLDGAKNVAFLLGIVLVIIGKGANWGSGGEPWPFGVQEALMAVLAWVAYQTTAPAIRRANNFSWAPIAEVAILFAGIFTTMIAPLLLLNAHASELGITSPAHYFWATGLLSSFLDNAPTYLSFAAAASGQFGVSVEGARYLGELLAKGEKAAALLTAISCGAVFMGANTYIGNGPNFMVKAIAEENGVKMPSFFGYMGYSVAILVPLMVAVTLVFF